MQVAALEPRRGRGHDRGAGTADARHRPPPQAGAAGRGGGHDAAPHQGAIASVEPNQQGRAHRSPSCRAASAPVLPPPRPRNDSHPATAPIETRPSWAGDRRREPASSHGPEPRCECCTVPTRPPQVNGVSVVTALSVAGLARRGWDCAVVAPRYPPEPTDARRGGTGGSAPVTSLPSVAVPGYAELRLAIAGRGTVRQLVQQFQPDLVHCETEFSIGWMGRQAASAAGIPVVSSYHMTSAGMRRPTACPGSAGP